MKSDKGKVLLSSEQRAGLQRTLNEKHGISCMCKPLDPSLNESNLIKQDCLNCLNSNGYG